MSANGFREDELVSRRVKVNGEWQTRIFPVVGGRLRLAHEQNDNLTLETEMVNWDGQYAVFKCCASTSKGRFIGYGTANNQRDARLVESLIELAETRSVARALRFAGYGMEYTGAEEMSHVAASDTNDEHGAGRQSKELFAENNGNAKTEANSQEPAMTNKPKPQNSGNGKATTAQVRALFALTRKANYQDEDIQSLINPFNVSRFEDLPREAASQLIGYLQQEVAA